MATATQPLPPMPGPDVPEVLPDGKPHPAWYAYKQRLDALIRALRLEIP